MKNMFVVAVPSGPRIKLKHIEFNKEKHTVIMGRLVCKKTSKDLGQINRVYSEQ